MKSSSSNLVGINSVTLSLTHFSRDVFLIIFIELYLWIKTLHYYFFCLVHIYRYLSRYISLVLISSRLLRSHENSVLVSKYKRYRKEKDKVRELQFILEELKKIWRADKKFKNQWACNTSFWTWERYNEREFKLQRGGKHLAHLNK